jgi:23S rRNA (guanine2445-N2)-methyltransferase / 23S rRNA (guanine2069-N7)-methyltransferase
MELIVTCIPGLAGVLQQELAALNLPAQASGGAAVKLSDCSLEQAMTVCLWSRLAERVLLPLTTLKVEPSDAAEALAREFDIDAHLHADGALNVIADHEAGVRGDPRITSSVFCRNLSRQVRLQREPAGALCLRLHIAAEQASLFVDFSGVPLSRRGYRIQGGVAPLRESIAAAMLFQARWGRGVESIDAADKEQISPGHALVDPFCGSGTIAVEAALISIDKAPGLMREEFGILHWKGFSMDAWQAMRAEARERIRTSDEVAAHFAEKITIKAFDGNDQALRLARANAERAGVAGMIHFERREFGLLAARDFPSQGIVVTNPPWGERLEDRQRVDALHQGIGRRIAATARHWPLVILGSDVEVLDKLGTELVSQVRVKNGAITNFIRVTRPVLRAPVAPLQVGEPAFTLPDQAIPLANRLRKNGKQLRKWIDQEQIHAYRLYDRDLPEFNFSVDVYGEEVFVQEFAAPKTIDEKAAEQRRAWAVSAIRAVLGAHREQVFLRTRAQQKGNHQYQKLDARKDMSVVREGRADLLVNLSAYLDVGLFLDHRPLRLRFDTECTGKRFVNLFAYTGAGTVLAAVGGARSSVTVDASRTYLDWAAENLSLNGFSTEHHRLERADVMTWLEACREQFDVVFCDPPTFSNNKSRDDFVVQRDHGELIRWIMKRLEPGGVLYFSNNFRKFSLDDDMRKLYKIEDITRASVPPDFSRQGTPHHLFSIRHLQR